MGCGGKVLPGGAAAAGKLKEPTRSRLKAETEIEWASVLHRQGRMQEAGEMFQRGYSQAVADCWRAKLIACQGYLHWGDLCTDEGRYGEAEQHYRQALRSFEKISNPVGSIFALLRLGDASIRQGRRKEAEEAIQRAIALESQVVHEDDHPAEQAVISMSLPDLHFCREDYEKARQLYRESVASWERQVARPDHIDLGHLQMRLALAEARTGHQAEANEMYARAESTYAREWGEGHPKTTAARAGEDGIEGVGRRERQE